MSELPAWVNPAQMQLDTRFDVQGRWVSGPVNDAAVPKLAELRPMEISRACWPEAAPTTTIAAPTMQLRSVDVKLILFSRWMRYPPARGLREEAYSRGSG